MKSETAKEIVAGVIFVASLFIGLILLAVA